MTSAARIAAGAAVLTLAMLPLAGCGSPAGYKDTKRLEPAVVRVLEQRLMQASPRQKSSATATHVRRVQCEKLSGRDFRCAAVLGDGSTLTVPVRVSPDGKRFRLL